MDESRFIGLSKKGAQDLAEINNLIFRLIRIDDRIFLGYPEDSREDRVSIEIDNQKVSKAVIQ